MGWSYELKTEKTHEDSPCLLWNTEVPFFPVPLDRDTGFLLGFYVSIWPPWHCSSMTGADLRRGSENEKKKTTKKNPQQEFLLHSPVVKGFFSWSSGQKEGISLEFFAVYAHYKALWLRLSWGQSWEIKEEKTQETHCQAFFKFWLASSICLFFFNFSESFDRLISQL